MSVTVHREPSKLIALERELVLEAARDATIGIRDIGHAEDAIWLVADVDGAAVGVASLAYFNYENCLLDRLYVRPCARRRGVGEALVHAAMSYAVERGLSQLLVEVAGSSSSRFWRRCLDDIGVKWIAEHLAEVDLRPFANRCNP